MAYMNIGILRKLDIMVIKDNEILYEGNVDDTPDNIKEMRYKSIDQVSPMVIQV